MAEAFIGEVRMMAFTFAPRGWAQCNGQLLPVNQNQALNSLLGSTYGGDGNVTTGLPDLRGRVPVHMSGQLPQGARSGEEAHTLTTGEMPRHLHALSASGDPPDGSGGNQPAPAKVLSATSSGQMYSPNVNVQAMNPSVIGNAGGSQPHTNLMPYTVVGMCICLIGIYPSRT